MLVGSGSLPCVNWASSARRDTLPAMVAVRRADLINKEAAEKQQAAVMDELKCAICHEAMVNAHILRCTHTFCGLCIWKWVAQVRAPLHTLFLPTPHTRDPALASKWRRAASAYTPNRNPIIETSLTQLGCFLVL